MALTLMDDLLWRVTADGDGVTVEGIFLTNQGLVVLTHWGILRWTAEHAERIIENTLSEIGDDVPEPFVILRSPASTRALN